MKYDPDNKIVKLCAEGMSLEAQGKPDEALKVFMRAWDESTSDLEKFTSAHYVARHQQSIADKLKWDETALALALKIDNNEMKGVYPSLYLNVGKCYEDLHEYEKAGENYLLASSFIDHLATDGYGKMLRNGIMSALERINKMR